MCQKSELTAREQFDSNSKSKGMFSEFFNWNWKVVEGRKGKKKIEREREKLFSSLLTFLRSSRGIPSTLRCTWIVSSSKNPSLSSCSSAKAACASSLSLSLSLSLSRAPPLLFFFFFSPLFLLFLLLLSSKRGVAYNGISTLFPLTPFLFCCIEKEDKRERRRRNFRINLEMSKRKFLKNEILQLSSFRHQC